MKIEQVARIAHEVNRAYCRAIGDNSQPAWQDAPNWQRQSAINGVKFHLGNPGAGPAASHNSWLREKLENGWRYGPVKDPEKKEHPCCVPFEELPREQQAKDYLFEALVNSMAEAGLIE